MMLLCVDGLDPDLITEYKWDKLFRYNYKLEIPRECFVPDPDLGSTPHTTRVWATIFSGKKIDYGLIKREGLRKTVHDFLVRNKITWNRTKPSYRLFPSNENLETIFDHYHSFTWNIPTINPEWISTFPGYEAFAKFCKRELIIWSYICRGAMFSSFDLDAYYMRYIDYIGHNEPEKLKKAYDFILYEVKDLKRKRELVLLSDHGCRDGLHTNYAYLGSDTRFKAESVDEIRKDLERILGTRA